MKPQSIIALLLAIVASWSLVSGTAHGNSTVGAWALGPVWDISPINMLVLPTGKVMMYPGDIISGDDPRLWDPATNMLTALPQAGYDLFCTGHSFLSDGTILFTGGNLLTPFYGLPDASIYNPFTNLWTRLPDMNAARWYPSTTTMGTGDVLVMTGTIDGNHTENPLPQVWQTGLGTWRNLTNAMLKIYNYSWVYWTPLGKALVAGPEPTTRYLDVSGTGAWTTLTSFNHPATRDYGSSVMYDSSGKILIAGGGQPPTKTAEIIDLSAATPTWQYTNPMVFKRRHMNMTLLPDDNVLVTGGTSADGFDNHSQPVYAAEMWNISTRTWTTMASQTVGRFYHSNALLLPDGRVLSAGGTGSGAGGYTYQAEIYSPPYLFKGPRPTITSAPAHARYGETFFVGTPDAINITKARLIRLPAVTHAFDMNQRLIQVSFTQTTGGLNATAPASGNFAPPGHYMLFILNSNGAPSVAKIIQIDDIATTIPAAPSGLLATATSSSAITLNWTDTATTEDGFKIERKTGAGSFTEIATVGPNTTTYADSGLTASTAYTYQVRAYNTAGNSAYSNTASATTQAPGTTPAAPSGLAATHSSNTIILTWVDQSTNEASFKIERALGAGAFSQVTTVGANVTTYTDSGLAASTSYSYRVRAWNTSGDSTYSNSASATTSGLINVAGASPNTGFAYFVGQNFGTPGDTSVAPTISVLRIFENALELGPAHSAHVDIRNLGMGRFSHWGDTLRWAASDNTDPRTNGRTYTYRIGPSLPASPAAPSGLSATAITSSAIDLTWSDQSSNETGFKIERKTGVGAFAQIATVGPNTTTYADSGLTAGTAYSYQVRAYNTGGNSTYSNTASATTQTAVTAPAAPTGLAATAASSTSITLTWVDQSTNEETFKIERALGAGPFSQVGTGGPNVTTYTDTGLTASTSYSYRVRAANTGGDSAYSNTASATTQAAVTAPAAPTGLAATAASSTSITLTWADQSTNEVEFKIERALGAGPFIEVGAVGSNITTFADSGLTASTAYSYQVRAANTDGNSAYSNTASATTLATPPPIPAPPTGLGATATSSSAINLSWTDAATNEDGFKIERKLGAGAFAQVATVGPNVTTYADSGLTASTAYSYQVRAYNTGGDSTYSNTATATTLAAPPPIPAPPTGLGATATSSSAINLSWTDAATNEDGFKIERKLGAGAFVQVATVGPNVTTFADSGLTASTAYSYQVRAYNTGGDSAYSNTATATTLATPPPIPAPPTGLGATATSSSAINLSWTDAATNEDGFKIERKLGAGAFVQVATVGPNVTTYADSGLTASTAYSYQVRAYNTGGDSAYSNTATATTLATPPPIPAPPTGLGATATSSSAINLSWTDAATNEDGFKIERKIGAGAFVQIATVGPNVTTYADSGLTASTAYSYQVRAYNTGGDSTYSNTASATTLAAPPPIPAPPTGLGATATSSSAINLSWTDAATNEDGFKIERKTGAGAFVQIATVGPNVTTFADSGLTATTAYSYQVRAYNTGGDSTYSNTATATTLTAPPPIPAPPTGLGATATSSSAINLSWTDAATNEDGFKIERKTGAGAFVQIATVGPNVTTYADSGLTASTAYSYQVRAYNTGGDSTYSNTATATTQAAATLPAGAEWARGDGELQ